MGNLSDLVGFALTVTIRYNIQHSKTQTTPLGVTTHEKVNEQQQHAISFLCLFLDILRSFMNVD